MKCPFCSTPDSKVIDSRLSGEGDLIRRRRECEKCQKRFTTYERVENVLPVVAKKDGRREIFDRLKIVHGLKKACEKRPVSMDVLETLVNKIERELQESGEKEVSSSAIGEMVMEALHQVDAVAYVRFASVYRSFKDVNQFMKELEHLLKSRNK
ncbi:MAG: transcriptional regulator NrdR [Deltaproteobacteria bacterium RIFCSPLOWO2_12_FULL_40_28]|nr:MAG: transcriptional regulator NrdR [Deltaproteobacteria bacterium RIFCSPHIGHO2_02_FULL_40_28]OGQ19641.1 MAG: transcriptional regulator NrdR [Deltaproteobacteria bacterium RIFCSPHIGHO2_12_FULL_40_32]OGQ40918.1 MAG: transcriptional regulator NrdR [Deltaproteobacteria bacterium RIFCSPLOWO2_02_FULL_40_36]OGQ54033.1 MAG: transcriptional regulator NrdR [Deltaproteobacteria bacterium RIFCSPLOWO2_12_FULL_40_28]